jgi:lysophospholipase L1-like esterase
MAKYVKSAMFAFSKQVVLLAVLCALTAASPCRAVDIHGEHVDPNREFGSDVDYLLTADAKFGWRTGTIAGDLDLNGHAFVMDTGGGNRTIFRGAIFGPGSFEWIGGGVPQVDASILTGTTPNTFQGTFVLSKGVLDLDKPDGICAVAGELVIGSKASAVVRLQQPNQIDDRAEVTFGGPETCGLELGGHDERFASLTLQTHAEITFGTKPATLVVSEGGPRSWDQTKTLTIRTFKPGRDRIVFGKNERGLSTAQLARIGFASPVGMPDGLYTAVIGNDGVLRPDARVSAKDPPFDVSAAAVTERTKRYKVSGIASLVKEQARLTTDLRIDCFGDSITWQNGFIGLIDKALQAGDGSGNGKSIQLINRGINGGGVVQVRDGTKEGAYPGNSPQPSFAEVIAADRADAVVVFIGINDVWWRNTTPADFEQALRDLVATAVAQKTKLVLATLSIRGELPDGTNPDDRKIEQFAELTRKVAADTETTLVDLRRAYIAYLQNHNAQLRVDGTLYSKSSGTLTYDGVHPNGTGNALLANLLCDGIVRALQTKSQANELIPLQPGAAIDYSKLAFQPKSWEQRGLSLQLIPWTGKQVVFLTTDDQLDRRLMALWVSRLDAGWQRYAELTGRRPQPLRQIEGKATIAAVPGADLTCGVGCGYVGATGIELAMFYDRNYPDLQKHPEAMPHYVFYEMGRNFYTFGDRHSCFTTGFAVFMRYVCTDSLKVTDLDADTRRVIESVEPLLATSDLSFFDLFTNVEQNEKAGRIKDRNGKEVSPSDQPVCYASAMLRLRREHGGDAWVKRFFHQLATCPTSNPSTREGALQQAWYWLLSASVAAKKDLSPVFAGEWKLPLADATRAALGTVAWQKHDLTVQEVAATVTPEWIKSAAGPQPTRADAR